MRELVEIVLKIALIIALLCSLFILVQFIIYKKKEYSYGFMAWQAPMLAALLLEIYLVE